MHPPHLLSTRPIVRVKSQQNLLREVLGLSRQVRMPQELQNLANIQAGARREGLEMDLKGAGINLDVGVFVKMRALPRT